MVESKIFNKLDNIDKFIDKVFDKIKTTGLISFKTRDDIVEFIIEYDENKYNIYLKDYENPTRFTYTNFINEVKHYFCENGYKLTVLYRIYTSKINKITNDYFFELYGDILILTQTKGSGDYFVKYYNVPSDKLVNTLVKLDITYSNEINNTVFRDDKGNGQFGFDLVNNDNEKT